MNSEVLPLPVGRSNDQADSKPPAPIVTEGWVVATEVDGAVAFLCSGYRDDSAVTMDVTTAEFFASPWAAEEARARYVDRHRDCEHGLKGWRLLVATTKTTFR